MFSARLQSRYFNLLASAPFKQPADSKGFVFSLHRIIRVPRLPGASGNIRYESEKDNATLWYYRISFHLVCYKLTPTMSAGSEQSLIARRLATVKHIILVLSGKGGVGKSSVSVQLALSLYASSPTARVGILDIDLTGPSIPRMMGVDGQPVHQSVAGWVPVYADQEEARMACMSVGFLLKRKEDSVVWRGPKKNAMIRQFLSDVRWGDLDYLVVDTPPG